MQNLEKRIAALESQSSTVDVSLKLVFAEDGETRAQAMSRAGYLPDAAGVMCVSFPSTPEPPSTP